MKPKDFEEWDCSSKNTFKDCWDTARIGMIPEDEAIRIPLEKEWPEWARWIRLQYVCGYPSHDSATIQVITRSKPAWVPKVGEAVFVASMHLDVVRYGVVTVVANGGVGVVFPDGSKGEYTFDRVKPGITTYIGKPWSEIPGGNE